ncbi:MAG: hypothetical protein RL095_1101 [Verrucomicrobiota bacterium]
MKVSDFDFELPEDLIASRPAQRRDESRMMVLDPRSGTFEIRSFRDFPEYFKAGDALVMNDTRVIPARLFGRKEGSGGRAEMLLVEELRPGRWLAFVKPGRRLPPGTALKLADGSPVRIAARRDDGQAEIDFDTAEVLALLDRLGQIPLPPYMNREADVSDRERYQTVFASRPGAIAAPTAGLHFTPEMLAGLSASGIEQHRVTLHVGPGTFLPVAVEDVRDHRMHEEIFELAPEVAASLRRTHQAGGRITAVGTTSVRTLETCADPECFLRPGAGRTAIFMHPPRRPAVVDRLLTNFHLPRSTLMMLVSCFAPRELVLEAYRCAVREKMRFYSYGDCMLIL